MTEVRITKRRALVARLLAVVFPIAALGVPAATALAVPATPKLVATNPESSESATADATFPSVLGEAEPEDGFILERAPFFMASSAAMGTRTVEKPTAHPNYEIQIFTSAECQGTVAAHGSAELLEGVGIPVTVAANFATTFSAVQINPSSPSEPSACSNPLTYWEGSVAGSGGGAPTGGQSSEGGEDNGAGNSGSGSGGSGSSSGSKRGGSIGSATPAGGKPEAPQIHTNPGGRANDLTPFVVGSAPGSSSVFVYTSSNCSGTPVAKGTPAQLSSGFEVPVAANAETAFSAVSVGTQHSSCSRSVTYAEDSTAPRTRVTMGPGVKTRKHAAVLRFKDVTSDPPGTTFVCKVDKQKWKRCASPFHIKHLKLGNHVIRIRATDLAGNVERHPVKRGFRVVPRA